MVFPDKIGGKGVVFQVGLDFGYRPETAFLHFVVTDVDPVVAGAEKGVNEFFLPGTFP